MSYAVRNTIILLVTLFIIVGIGFGVSRFYLESSIEKLEGDLSTKQNDFNSKQNIGSDFTELNNRYEAALVVMSNYDKLLYPSNKPDDVYDFLDQINADGGRTVYFDFVYNDSIPNIEYGILGSTLSGYGDYRAVVGFINKIENSQLLNKVKDLAISPTRADEEPTVVNFSFDLDSYYGKSSGLDSVITEYKIVENESISRYNPLYPLIQQTIPPNSQGMTDVRSSRLIGMTESQVFVRNQTGRIVTLRQGDQVYLGSLSTINLQNNSATFTLNVGGIIEVITLEVVR